MPPVSREVAMIAPLAFYRVLPLHSPYMYLVLAIVTTFGALALIVDPSSAEQVLMPLVVLQMFTASTGFAVPARRGHYDLLLTAGAGRLGIAAAHFLVSTAPGIAAWLVLGCVELVRGGGESRVFAAGSVAALMFVSSVTWAVTVALPCLSGGIIWLLAIVMLLVRTGGSQYVVLATPPHSSPAWVAPVYATCPFVLVGRSLSPSDAWVLMPGTALSVVSVAAALAWITRMNVPLEASQ